MAQGPKRGDFEHMWLVPRKGVLHNFPIYETPEGALFDALNVLVRQGVLKPRPGIGDHSPTSLLDRPMGAFVTTTLATGAFQADAFQNDAFQVSGGGSNVFVLAGTTRRIWVFIGGNWIDITDTQLTGEAIHHVRFTGIEIGGTIWTVIVNGVDTPRKWDNTSATVTPVTGTPPIFSDVTTISDRIIGIVPPFGIRWGNAYDLGTWPALNFRDLTDTMDRMIAIRNMGTLGGAIYKENSIWSVIPIGGTDAAFFRFELRGFYKGPASPAAIVDANGTHYYMTTSGRIGAWNGTAHDWVADGVWEIIREDLDPTNMNRAFGIYEPNFDEVYFAYPRVGDSGELKGGVVIQRPRPKDGISEHISFPLRFERPISAGTDLRLESNKALVFTSDTFRSKFLEGPDDAGTEFSGFWQPGLASTPKQLPYRIEEMEVFARRSTGAGSLTVKPVSSNLLDTEGGTIGAGVAVDLADATKVRDLKGTDIRARFLGLRHEFTTPINLAWLGSRLTANPLEG
jgi:hypothetical protein